MSETKFRLVFRGDYFPDCDLPDVKGKMAALLKVNQAKVEALFSGKTVTLKSGLSNGEALRLKEVFDRTGGLSCVEPMEGVPNVPRSAFSDVTPQQNVPPLTRPQPVEWAPFT